MKHKGRSSHRESAFQTGLIPRGEYAIHAIFAVLALIAVVSTVAALTY